MAQAPATVTTEINGIYVAMYGLPATQAGINFWVKTLSAFDSTVTAANAALTPISAADQLFLGQQMTANSPQVGGTSYFATLYPASMTDTTFVQALYQNMSNFQGTGAGVQFWVNQLQGLETGGMTTLQARESIAGTFVYAFLSNDLTVGAAALGVSAADYASLVAGQQTLFNKVAVSVDWANTTAINPTSILNYSSTTSPAFAAAMGLIANVNANPVSATNADTAIANANGSNTLTPITTLVPVPSGAIFALTTAIDIIGSTGSGDVVVGTLTGATFPNPTSTLNPGDLLNMNGGTLKVVDTSTAVVPNELAGVMINGPFVFQVQDVSNPAGGYDFGALSTVSKVISSNSTHGTNFTTLPTGTVVESSGAATAAGATVTFAMASSTAAVSVQFDGGVNGVTVQDTAGAATTATVSSTGAANGATAFVTTELAGGGHTLTSETISAATNLTSAFTAGDWKGWGAANADTLTVQGAAASVNLDVNADVVDANTVNASGLTAGGLTAAFGADVKSFTGGAGNDVIFLTATPGATANYNEGAGNNMLLETAAYGPLPIGTVANGGSATATNVISAQLLSAGDAANITNFQIMDLGFAAATTYDAAVYSGDQFTGVTYTGGTGGTGFAATATGNATVSDLVGTSETLSVTGTVNAFDETHTITLTQANAATATASTGDTLAISFANNANPASFTEFTGPIVTSHLVTETINAGTTVTPGTGTGIENDLINQLQDKANLLSTVTITGSANLFFIGGGTEGVSTDTGTANPASATKVASSLTLIDGSAAIGNLTIAEGLSVANPGGTNANLTVTYTGLTIKGGSGIDNIENDAANGTVVLGNGGTSANPTIGIATSNAETVTFGSGFDQATFTTVNVTGTTFDTGTINGTIVNQDRVNLISFVPTSVTDLSTNAGITSATSLLNAESFASTTVGAHGVGYFTWVDGNEYIVANAATTGNVQTNIAIELVGAAFHHISLAAGFLTLTT